MLENQSLQPALSEELSDVLPIAMVKLDGKGKVLSMNRASHDLLTVMKISPEDLPQALPQRHRFLVRQALRDKLSAETDWVQNGRAEPSRLPAWSGRS